MPISLMNAPQLLTPAQSSPFGGALAMAIKQRLDQAKAEAEEQKVPYAGQTARADILSKLAYASVVNPQMLMKAASNPAIWSQMTEEEKRGVGKMAGNAATGGGSNPYNPLMQQAVDTGNPNAQNSNKTMGERIRDLFSWGHQDNAAPMASPQTAPVAQPNANPSPASGGVDNYSHTVASPQEVNQVANNGNGSGTAANPSIPTVIRAGATDNRTADQQQQEYVSEQERAKAGGAERGRKEEDQIAKYGDAYKGLTDQKVSIDKINKTLQNPALGEIVNTPFINQKAISWYKNSGTPEQKRAIAEQEAAMNSYIGASTKDFGSQFTNRDLQFLETLKPSPTDLWDARKGKMESLTFFNEVQRQKMKIAHDLMRDHKMDKFQAEDSATKALNIDKLYEAAHNKIYPPPAKVKLKDGRTVDLPKQGLMQLQRDHPDYVVEVLG